ncbi:5-nitroimidazole antibiotic resistance protein [Pseudoflavonifractor sp. 524-17]|uniref:pyridoxamine 5'-phosphate oxidase family protein n=1 Tax=Pseudoflavonifractor sp. 524-17 TaxID=2304577 RepID=UPI001379DD95|nr:pyridoxamine 5'-phosphate oxidase family protein [Pseudoflavonifractor sp. 524-17]NCE65211.1 5-nitroimidazole antibiotic resistance protein [Pseudoflavonifractor sp. 524-17]
MRRKDREMGQEFALMVLDKAEWMTLAMTGLDGAPYCIPINMARQGEWLYLHSAPEGEKAQCLRVHPKVCVTAVGDTHVIPERYTTEFESAVVRGTAEELTENQDRLEALRIFCAKYCGPQQMGERFEKAAAGSFGRTALFRIHMDEITAKRKKYAADGTELKYGAMG